MIIPARPSKAYFYKHFTEDMKYSEGLDVGADIACANLKNRRFFKTKKVICVDKNSDVFKNKTPDEKTEFRIDDILNLSIPNNHIDFLVSTHTLSHIYEENHYNVINSFVKVIKNNGYLLFNMPVTNIKTESFIDELLYSSFNKVKRVNYNNFILRSYEKAFSDSNGSLTYKNNYRLLKANHLKLFSRILSNLDYLPLNTGMRYYFCENKQG